MKPFEEQLQNQRDRTFRQNRDRIAASAARSLRRITREERLRRRRATLSILFVVALFSGMVILLLTVPAKSDELSDSTENAVTGVPVKAITLRRETEVNSVDWVPEDFENQRIEEALLSRATVIEDYIIENCTVTHYCICEQCCGKEPSDPAYGITRSGLTATPGVSVAVDPSVIPLGSDVLADYGDGIIHYYRADDTGSAVKGSHIDLCVSSHQEALQLGRTTATVYYVPQEDAK